MKILVIFTGGTIGSSADGEFIDIDKSSHYKLLEMYEKKYGRGVDFSVREPFDILSENMTYEYIFRIAKELRDVDISAFDGVIVTHGTDTLQYTSSCLGYMFCGAKTPIVLVSSDKPLDCPDANGLDNFAAAVDFIKSGTGGVYVSYKNKNDVCRIHEGTRLLPHAAYSDSIFSLNGSSLADVENGTVRYNGEYSLREDEIVLPELEIPTDAASVLFLYAYVGMGDCIRNINVESVDSVIIGTYHSGTLPVSDKSFQTFCGQMKEQGKPVYVCGGYMVNGYASSALYGALRLISLPPASPIAMQTKYVLLNSCGRTEDMGKRLANDFENWQIR